MLARNFHLCLSSIFVVDLLMRASAWPEGTYGLPMPKTGCPIGPEIEWETGTRTQMTEKGSHPSEAIHLAGVEPTYSEHVVQLFCMKMSYPQDGGYSWMPGKYCIFKKGDCPAKFHEGFIGWDDASLWYNKNDHRQTFKGVLPEGDFDHNTKLFYCCRTDGSPYNPIVLPPEAPFFLLKFGDFCQEVDQMVVNEEWVYWSIERSSSATQQGGMHPKIIRSQIPRMFTKLYYCYYQPKPPNKVIKILTFLLYGIGGVIGLSMLASLTACIAKWMCRCRGLSKEAEWSGLGQDFSEPHPMVVGGAGESPRVYKYVTVRTTEAIGANGKVGGFYGPDGLSDEGLTYPALVTDQLAITGAHLYPSPVPLIPSAPSEWEDPQQTGNLAYGQDAMQTQFIKQPSLITTRVVLLKPTSSLYPDIGLAGISPYLPSYMDAMSVQKQE